MTKPLHTVLMLRDKYVGPSSAGRSLTFGAFQALAQRDLARFSELAELLLDGMTVGAARGRASGPDDRVHFTLSVSHCECLRPRSACA